MNDEDPIKIIRNLDGEITDTFSGNLFVDMATNNIVDKVKKEELEFDDMMVKSTIAVNCLVGHMKLMRLCAEQLTKSHEDYHIVMTFLDKIQEINDECAERGSQLSEQFGL